MPTARLCTTTVPEPGTIATSSPSAGKRLSLLRRMGPLAAGFDDAHLLELGRVSGADNSSLRQMYLRDRPAPALLVHVLQRARIQDQVTRSMALIAQGLAVPAIDDVPQLQAFYQAVAVYLGQGTGIEANPSQRRFDPYPRRHRHPLHHWLQPAAGPTCTMPGHHGSIGRSPCTASNWHNWIPIMRCWSSSNAIRTCH